MNVPTPKYFVLDNEGFLHGYDQEILLKIDLVTNQEDPPKQIFQLLESGLRTTYRPISASALSSTAQPTPILAASNTTLLRPAA
jgi:hypothetical protein